MSAQSAFFHAEAGLIETMRWQAGSGFFLLAEHLERLGESARILGLPCPMPDICALLARANETWADEPPGMRRARLVLDSSGEATLEWAALTLPAADVIWRVSVAAERFASSDPALRHKLRERSRYEMPLAEAARLSGADEVLFLNERDEVCEGARTNVFLRRGDMLITPPLASGLLPGTLRRRLIDEGRAIEGIVRLDDLGGEAEWFMGNSVRGLVRARRIVSPQG